MAIANRIADRVGHVHFKDVDSGVARRLTTGSIAWAEVVGGGMFRPLGDGDIDFPAILADPLTLPRPPMP